MFWREIVWYVEHDVADDATDRRQRLWGDVFECVLVDCRIFDILDVSSVGLKGNAMTPINLLNVSTQYFNLYQELATYRQYHNAAHILSQVAFDVRCPKFYIDLSSKRIHRVCEMKRFHAL